MKKIILSIVMLASIVFISCSDDDNTPAKKCETCQVNSVNIKICDAGNGKVEVTTAGQTVTITLPQGVTYEEYAENACLQEAIGI